MMTCTDYRHWLSPYIDGLLTPPQRAELEAHLQPCAGCRQELASLQQMLRALHTMEAPEAPDLIAGVHAKLHRQPWWQRMPAVLPVTAPWRGAALAATALLVVAVVGLPRMLQRGKADVSSLQVASAPAGSFDRVARKQKDVALDERRATNVFLQRVEETDRLERDDKPMQLAKEGVPPAREDRVADAKPSVAATRAATAHALGGGGLAGESAQNVGALTVAAAPAGEPAVSQPVTRADVPTLIQVQWRVPDFGQAAAQVSQWVSAQGGFAVATNERHLSIKLPAAAVPAFLQQFSSGPSGELPTEPYSPWVNISLDLMSVQPVDPAPQAGAEQLLVSAEDQACDADADCTDIQTTCNGCACNEPVNVIHKAAYVKRLHALCADFHEPMCDYYCRTPYVRCLDHQCTMSASPPTP